MGLIHQQTLFSVVHFLLTHLEIAVRTFKMARCIHYHKIFPAFPYLELSIEDIHFKQLKTSTTYIIDTSLGSIKIFLFKPIRFNHPGRTSETPTSSTATTITHDVYYRTIEQVLIFSGPELKDEVETQMQHDDIR